MLQPSQLHEVLSRYAGEIAALRAFLHIAGCRTEDAASLAGVTARMQSDRAFRRDLTSYLWVAVDRSSGSISPSELLGILTLAISGEHFAALAGEDEAHRLLHFVMEARRSYEAVSNDSLSNQKIPADMPETASASTARSGSEPCATVSGQRPRRLVAWGIAAACILALSIGGAWLHHRGTSLRTTNITAVPSAAQPQVGHVDAGSPADHPSNLTADEPPATPTPDATSPQSSRAEKHVLPSSRSAPTDAASLRQPTNRHNVPPLEPESVATTAMLAPPAPVVRSDNIPTTAAFPRSKTARVPAAPVPADLLSKRLGARTLPQSSADDAGLPANRPRLLRRRPFVPADDTANDTQVAELRPMDRPRAASGSSSALHGVVRPTTLGMMAANILYSPAPAYPPAASAAHVQGQVTVQAAVDRDGNVAYARVVSGPPLLRDAAVDAVQHWRYRPYLAGGKPAAATATALLEFELQ